MLLFQITQLKIDNNPFAKGFRETGAARKDKKKYALPPASKSLPGGALAPSDVSCPTKIDVDDSYYSDDDRRTEQSLSADEASAPPGGDLSPRSGIDLGRSPGSPEQGNLSDYIPFAGHTSFPLQYLYNQSLYQQSLMLQDMIMSSAAAAGATSPTGRPSPFGFNPFSVRNLLMANEQNYLKAPSPLKMTDAGSQEHLKNFRFFPYPLPAWRLPTGPVGGVSSPPPPTVPRPDSSSPKSEPGPTSLLAGGTFCASGIGAGVHPAEKNLNREADETRGSSSPSIPKSPARSIPLQNHSDRATHREDDEDSVTDGKD